MVIVITHVITITSYNLLIGQQRGLMGFRGILFAKLIYFTWPSVGFMEENGDSIHGFDGAVN